MRRYSLDIREISLTVVSWLDHLVIKSKGFYQLQHHHKWPDNGVCSAGLCSKDQLSSCFAVSV